MNTEHSMGESTGITTEHTAMEDVAEKGKGKAIQEHTEGEEDSSSDDDQSEEEEEEEPENELAEIDTSNIIQGCRTRGKYFAVSGEGAMDDAMDDDDEDDDDEYKPEDEYKSEDDSMKD
ncbi:hypothetical protein L211DRAFT_835654 [Terfezia boudieri ATCC MYA-4762]|uniref:Histone chaperone domain-containing protein n=1 Tax=Terfezia boudieri ATCC MYA-4762 TaxID=1051890 RepID=A0A3N4LTS0_9PEZI|nr:hypothetical protein L211DRAFT_835654 [Terfezia boudieri ATCC MYA-4762]